jgi:hypothetical protein
MEFSGLSGSYYKEIYDSSSPAEREKALVEMIKRRTVDTAEITAASIENVEVADKPFTYAFHIRVPGYVELAGKRTFMQPNIFERGTGARFVKGERKFDVSFDYAWMELDDITIELPKGVAPDLPGTLPNVADDDGNIALETKMELSDDRRAIRYSRRFVFGTRSKRVYSKYAYQRVKGLFDEIHRVDSQSIMLVKDPK